MYRYSELRNLHLEPTTSCNAACPMCARNTRGTTAPGLPRAELTTAAIREMFPETFLAALNRVDVCGAYGDPALTAELLDILAHLLRYAPNCQMYLFTNGGVRSSAWWRQLASITGSRCTVVFAIDGLADTNAVYRRNVSFDKVMSNAAAFIAAGGLARWEYLVFRHNEHQVDQAAETARRMGFASFASKRTARFLDAAFDYVPEFATSNGSAPEFVDLTNFPVYSPQGELIGRLYPPEDAFWTSQAAEAALAEVRSGLLPILDKTPIACRAQSAKGIFVSATGHAYPCPWTYVQATRPTQNLFPDTANRQVAQLLNECGGVDSIHVPSVGLQAAVHSAFFSAVAKSWLAPSTAAGKLQICGRTCGPQAQSFISSLGDHKPSLPVVEHR